MLAMPAALEWRVQTFASQAAGRRGALSQVPSMSPPILPPTPTSPARPQSAAHRHTAGSGSRTLLFAWRRTVSSEPTGVGAAAEHHGKRVTDLHIN